MKWCHPYPQNVWMGFPYSVKNLPEDNLSDTHSQGDVSSQAGNEHKPPQLNT